MGHQPKARYRELHPELFDAEDFEYWKAEWGGMPEYTHELATPWRSVTMHFKSEADFVEFSSRLGMLMNRGRSFWFPPQKENP